MKDGRQASVGDVVDALDGPIKTSDRVSPVVVDLEIVVAVILSAHS